MNALGTVSVVVNYQDTSNGQLSYHKGVETLSRVVADPTTCTLAFHVEVYSAPLGYSGPASSARDLTIYFGLMQKVIVEPYEKSASEQEAGIGHPEIVAVSTSPQVTLVEMFSSKPETGFIFYDADLADRVAKAINHAVELCGGGSKEPF